MRRQRQERKSRQKYQKRKQRSSFLNRYHFAYACTDTVNQLRKIAPGVIKNASSEINKLQRINQIIRQSGQEV